MGLLTLCTLCPRSCVCSALLPALFAVLARFASLHGALCLFVSSYTDLIFEELIELYLRAIKNPLKRGFEFADRVRNSDGGEHLFIAHALA